MEEIELKSNPYKEDIHNLTKSAEHPKIKKIISILKEQLQTKLISFKITNQGFFDEMKKSIEDPQIYQAASQKLKDGNITDDYATLLLHLSQLMSRTKGLQLSKNIKFFGGNSSPNSPKNYYCDVEFGGDKLFYIEIECRSKDDFKKSSCFYMLESLYPTSLVILSLNKLSSNTNFIEDWDNLKNNPEDNSFGKKVEEFEVALSPFDKLMFAKDPLNCKIRKLEHFKKKKIEPSTQKKCYESYQIQLARHEYSTSACSAHQKFFGKSLTLDVSTIENPYYSVIAKSNDSILFQVHLRCQNKKKSKNIAALIYFKLYYKFVYRRIAQVSFQLYEGNVVEGEDGKSIGARTEFVDRYWKDDEMVEGEGFHDSKELSSQRSREDDFEDWMQLGDIGDSRPRMNFHKDGK